MTKSTHLQPVHRSRKSYTHKPRNMEQVKGVTADQVECIERLSLEIFTDCVNAGVSFQTALGSIMVTGLTWGVEFTKNKDQYDLFKSN